MTRISEAVECLESLGYTVTPPAEAPALLSLGVIAPDYDTWQETDEAYATAPYVVHSAGPDDVLPARSWREAVAVAQAINFGVVAYTERTKNDGMVRSWATPYLWADAEAAGVVVPRKPSTTSGVQS